MENGNDLLKTSREKILRILGLPEQTTDEQILTTVKKLNNPLNPLKVKERLKKLKAIQSELEIFFNALQK
jgi:hypothetical protein